jgi:hypothetical protein
MRWRQMRVAQDHLQILPSAEFHQSGEWRTTTRRARSRRQARPWLGNSTTDGRGPGATRTTGRHQDAARRVQAGRTAIGGHAPSRTHLHELRVRGRDLDRAQEIDVAAGARARNLAVIPRLLATPDQPLSGTGTGHSSSTRPQETCPYSTILSGRTQRRTPPTNTFAGIKPGDVHDFIAAKFRRRRRRNDI